MIEEKEDQHWLQRSVSVGQLLLSIIVLTGTLTAFALTQERRLTELHERQQQNIKRIDDFVGQFDRHREQLQFRLDKIDTRLTELLILNSAQHPPILGRQEAFKIAPGKQ